MALEEAAVSTVEGLATDAKAAQGPQRGSLWRQVIKFFKTSTICSFFLSNYVGFCSLCRLNSPRATDVSKASTYTLAIPVGSVLAMCLNDVLGRVTLVESLVVPYTIGWALIASASSFVQLVVGRLCTGIAVGLAHSPSMLYITEVASKDVRGGLTAFGTALSSIGIVGCYVMGAMLPWRTHAWANCAVPVVPILLQCVFAKESPVWLRARGRTKAAATSSQYFYNDPNEVLSVPSAAGKRDKSLWQMWGMLFTDPMGYRPLLLVFFMFLLQQLVGVYITIYYAVSFFQESGSTIDAYVATILVGMTRFVGCTVAAIVMTRFGRRTLMTVSSLGQTVFMAISGYATFHILKGPMEGDIEPGSLSSAWVVGGVLGYIALSSLGWQIIPWSMMAEVFPHEVRSLAQPINSAMTNLIIFAILQVYPYISDVVRGAAGTQFLFAGMSAISAVFVVVFLPETRGRTLQEIEDYWRNNATFVTEKRRRRAARRAAAQAALAAGAAPL